MNGYSVPIKLLKLVAEINSKFKVHAHTILQDLTQLSLRNTTSPLEPVAAVPNSSTVVCAIWRKRQRIWTTSSTNW